MEDLRTIPRQKKEILWEIIYESTLTSARQLKWDTIQVENAYKQGSRKIVVNFT